MQTDHNYTHNHSWLKPAGTSQYTTMVDISLHLHTNTRSPLHDLLTSLCRTEDYTKTQLSLQQRLSSFARCLGFAKETLHCMYSLRKPVTEARPLEPEHGHCWLAGLLPPISSRSEAHENLKRLSRTLSSSHFWNCTTTKKIVKDTNVILEGPASTSSTKKKRKKIPTTKDKVPLTLRFFACYTWVPRKRLSRSLKLLKLSS